MHKFPGAVARYRPGHAQAGIGVALSLEQHDAEQEQHGAQGKAGEADEIEIGADTGQQEAKLGGGDDAHQRGQGRIENVLGLGKLVFRQQAPEQEKDGHEQELDGRGNEDDLAGPKPIGRTARPMGEIDEIGGNAEGPDARYGQGDGQQQEMEAGDEALHGGIRKLATYRRR